jgi:hypothetical protein
VRALVIGALALSLLGCSHSAPPQVAAPSCPDAARSACAARSAGKPVRLASFSSHAAPEERKLALAAKSARPLSDHARVRLAAKAAMSSMRAARQEATALRIALPPAAPPATTVTASRPAADVVKPETRTVQQQMATAAAAQAVPASPRNADSLIAIVMARPDVKSVSDLAGKSIAIDDKYSASSSTVRKAIVAAGAPEVQLSVGQSTAITRLTNGEVPAAVLALVAPDAADTFPVIAGFRIFHVPLSPRSVTTRP